MMCVDISRPLIARRTMPQVSTPNSGGAGGPGGSSGAPTAVFPLPGTFPWANSSRGKPRRGMMRRAVFSDLQRKGLEKRFQIQKYISKPDRKKLAEKLGLKDSQRKPATLVLNLQLLSWPPRSPDLRRDFYLREYVKYLFCIFITRKSTRVTCRTINAIGAIDVNTLHFVSNEVDYLLDAAGIHSGGGRWGRAWIKLYPAPFYSPSIAEIGFSSVQAPPSIWTYQQQKLPE
ncbi:hypothetical protein C0J52_16441 [Blattella germanica]|nr:hypothetical protein C0J52_16441 [Blattella germanica]